jgi:hypothetical protein
MLRLWMKVVAALAATAVAATPAGTVEQVHRTDSGSVRNLGSSEA